MRKFLEWWFEQLASCVPSALLRRWHAPNDIVNIEIEKDRLFVYEGDGGDKIDIDLSERQPDPVQPDHELMGRLPANLNMLRIRLAPNEFLVRRLTLPTAARSHLREAVGYQLPKLTPFNTSQVFYACGMDVGSPENDANNVWLVAAPRKKIAIALEALGLEPPGEFLDLKGPPASDESLEFVWHFSSKQDGTYGLRKSLWFGALATLAMAIGLHFYNKYRIYDSYSQRLSGLQEQVRKVGQLQDYIDKVGERADYLNNKKLSATSTLEILDALTRELGDDTRLQNLEIRDDKISIQGLSPSPAGLIELLEGLPMFNNARFESAITQDPRQGLSRFRISADIAAPTTPGPKR